MIRNSLGQPKAGIAANERCIELYDRLLVSDPSNCEYRLERAERLRSAPSTIAPGSGTTLPPNATIWRLRPRSKVCG